MEREGEHRQMVVPMGFYTQCKICFKPLGPGATFYRIGICDVCEDCEGKTEPHTHRLEPMTTAGWMQYEGRT